ncbi:hypothetical protein CLV44_11978 [Marinobacterium halophilum]|uniref:Uncharacterized protein n=1 Tax=Marinobacterium halophilum TaxID=267374 RepID=A0A2P8ES12_9GAMM|nr:hypothetical protein [Marinobacterium halophilum]PSL12243.1 hypothetical protein CLV44_11978 [Marinobacterium halophilum]
MNANGLAQSRGWGEFAFFMSSPNDHFVPITASWYGTPNVRSGQQLT